MLEGTLKTPLGAVPKKTATIIGIGGLVIVGIVYYRQKQQDMSTPVTDGEINPATGYPYGSPEDAAALAAQSTYVSPPAPSGGGSSNVPQSNVGFSSNGQWVQAVVEYMLTNNLVEDSTNLSTALGRYITGAYATAEEQSLIQQAIAVEGFPPVAGTNGYPPSINKTPPTTSGTPAAPPPTVSGLHLTSAGTTSLTFGWSYGATKPDYQLVYLDNHPHDNIPGTQMSYTFKNLKRRTTHKCQVRGVKGSTIGASAAATGTTK